MKKIRLAIFASGSGTNTEAIVKYFHDHPQVEVSGIYSNNPNAYVLQRARKLQVPGYVFTRQELNDPAFVDKLEAQQVDLIVLAGFLWLLPANLVARFPQRIINIHPALLPKYGGKGMYGHHVHAAVLANREKESGITIHYVNERYDEGTVIFQARCPVYPDDTPDTLAQRIHALEHKHYPEIIEKIALALAE